MPKDTTLEIMGDYIKSMRSYDTQKAFSKIRDLLDEANNMLNTTEPWKKSGEEKGKILIEGIVYVYYATLLFAPFIPEATEKVMQSLQNLGRRNPKLLELPMSINLMSIKDIPDIEVDLDNITKPEILFVKK